MKYALGNTTTSTTGMSVEMHAIQLQALWADWMIHWVWFNDGEYHGGAPDLEILCSADDPATFLKAFVEASSDWTKAQQP